MLKTGCKLEEESEKQCIDEEFKKNAKKWMDGNGYQTI